MSADPYAAFDAELKRQRRQRLMKALPTILLAVATVVAIVTVGYGLKTKNAPILGLGAGIFIAATLAGHFLSKKKKKP